MANQHGTRTNAELVEVLRLVESTGSKTAAAKALGIPRGTLSAQVSMAAARGLTAGSTVYDKEAKLSIEVKQLKRQLETIQRDQDTAETVRKHIFDLSAHTPDPPKWLIQPGKSGARGVPNVMWSDWHYGEVVRPEEVGGVNEFNMEIAKKRVTKLVNTTMDLAFNHMGRAKTDYPGIVVNLGGDMISGDIHEELMVTNDRTPYQAVNDLVDILAGALGELADKFGRVFVACVVGNHGRGTHKPRMKGRVFTSFEWIIYQMLEKHFRNDDRLSFMIPGETDAYYRVYGYRYLLTHGDSLGVKGGDGIIGSLGPIMRGALKVGRSEAQIGREFDTVVMGHWHQYIIGPGNSVIVNNSLKGYDEYARLALRAPYSRPSQALWFTHPEHGITAHWQVFLEKSRTANDNRKWVEFQK